MTPEIIKEFLVSIGFDVDDASYAKAMVGAGALAAAVGATILGVTRQVQAFVDDAAADLDSLAAFSRRIKEDAALVERLEYAASILDSTAEAARSSLENVAEQIGRAANKMPRALKLFERLGLNWKKSNGQIKTGVELLGDVSERLRGMESREKQLAFLSSLGIDPSMLRTLTEDWGDLADELDRVRKATGLTTQEAADLGSEYETARRRLASVIEIIKQSIALKLMPRLKEEMTKLRAWLVEHLPDILDKVVPVLNQVLDIAHIAFDLFLRAGEAAADAYVYYKDLDEATGGLLSTFLAFKAAWLIWNSELAKSETGTILKLASLFLLLYDDYKVFKEGGKSLIDWDGWFGRGLIWLGKWYVRSKLIGAALSLIASALWEIGKVLFVLWAVNKAFGVLLWLTSGISWLNKAMKFLWVLSLWDDVLLLLGGVGLLIAALAYLAYKLGLFDKDTWKNSMEGYRRFFVWLGRKLTDAYGSFKSWAWACVDAIKEAFGDAKTWIASWFTWITDNMPDLPGIDVFPGSSGAALVPSPAQQAALFGNGSNLQAETNIYVNGAGDPNAVANKTAGLQKSVNADLTRNFKGAVE